MTARANVFELSAAHHRAAGERAFRSRARIALAAQLRLTARIAAESTDVDLTLGIICQAMTLIQHAELFEVIDLPAGEALAQWAAKWGAA